MIVAWSLASAVGAGSPQRALAATITVDSTADDLEQGPNGNCTLREAVAAANTDLPVDACAAGLGADVIDLPRGVLEPKTTGEGLRILAPTELRGRGVDRTVIHAILSFGTNDPDADQAPMRARDLTIVSSALFASDLEMVDMTIRRDPAFPDLSSGVYCSECELRRTEIDGYTVNFKGQSVASHSIFRNDSRLGISVDHGSLFLEHSRIEGNGGDEGQGGLWAQWYAQVEIEGCTFAGNRGKRGGALQVSWYSSVTVRNSTFSGNHGSREGGAIFVDTSNLKLEHVTFVGNDSPAGGAVAVAAVPNTAYPRPKLVFRSSIIQGSCSDPTSWARIYSEGGNLEGPGSTCRLHERSDLANVADLGLGPLADNGGPTPTHEPQAWSPAVDSVPRKLCPGPDVDQRDVTRPQDGDGNARAACDRGAVERTYHR